MSLLLHQKGVAVKVHELDSREWTDTASGSGTQLLNKNKMIEL